MDNNKSSKLTPRQDKAIKHFILNGDKSAAYRHAYSTQNMKQTTINKKGYELFNKGHIRAIIQEKQNEKEEEFNLSVSQRKKMLATGAALGLKMKKDAHGNSVPHSISGSKECISELNRMDGSHAPVKGALTDAKGEDIIVNPTKAELIEEMKERKLPTDVLDK